MNQACLCCRRPKMTLQTFGPYQLQLITSHPHHTFTPTIVRADNGCILDLPTFMKADEGCVFDLPTIMRASKGCVPDLPTLIRADKGCVPDLPTIMRADKEKVNVYCSYSFFPLSAVCISAVQSRTANKNIRLFFSKYCFVCTFVR